MSSDKLDRLIMQIEALWADNQDRAALAAAIHSLDTRYALKQKIAKEPGVQDVLLQMFGRLARSFPELSELRGKRVLDIACGSITSRAPGLMHVETPSGRVKVRRGGTKGYTAQFEPWFCRILVELGATPVGLDLGDLEQEAFTHHRVDLGQIGTLDFLPNGSFDALQDSRLFGSPEFTAQFPKHADRLRIAKEIWRQEQRLLRPDGILIHSDARALLK